MEPTAYKSWLSLVWFGFAGLLFFLMLVYSLRGVPFGTHTGEVWSWMLPNLMPTLTLIVSVLVMDARASDAVPSQGGSSFLFKLAMSLSVAYLIALCAVLVIPAN